MKAECKTFRAKSWEDAITQAQNLPNEFVQQTGSPANVLSVSDAAEALYALVFVWHTA